MVKTQKLKGKSSTLTQKASKNSNKQLKLQKSSQSNSAKEAVDFYESHRKQNPYIIPAEGKSLANRSFLFCILAAISCYICIFAFIVMDIFVTQFQFFYFGIFKIPKIKRSDYIVIDRHLLKKLNFFQKLNCVYCGYANGLVGYCKAVVNQMELYSCAIKHLRQPQSQEHHKEFYPRSKFE
jgi:hypothetical protein